MHQEFKVSSLITELLYFCHYSLSILRPHFIFFYLKVVSQYNEFTVLIWNNEGAFFFLISNNCNGVVYLQFIAKTYAAHTFTFIIIRYKYLVCVNKSPDISMTE